MSSTNHVLDAILAPEGKELASPLEAAADRPKTETARAAPRFWISKQPVEAATGRARQDSFVVHDRFPQC